MGYRQIMSFEQFWSSKDKHNAKKPKKIAFIGTHSTGKDTLSHDAFSYLKLQHKKTCYYISEIAEQALKQGLALKRFQAQFWMMARQIQEELEAQLWAKREYIICNRSIIDSIPYSKAYADKGYYQKKDVNALEEIAVSYLEYYPYDLIFFMRPFDTIEKDGVREVDEEGQKLVDYYFGHLLTLWRIPVHIVGHTVKSERLEYIRTVLDGYVKKSR